jgi:hypothetical protein
MMFVAAQKLIPPSGPFPYLTAVTDTIGATSVGDPPDPSCQLAGFRSIWYRFTPSASGDYAFTTVPFTATRVADTLMAVYKAASCGGPYTEVACNDDAVGYRAAVTLPLTAATTYFVVVWDFDEIPTPGFTTVRYSECRQ